MDEQNMIPEPNIIPEQSIEMVQPVDAPTEVVAEQSAVAEQPVEVTQAAPEAPQLPSQEERQAFLTPEALASDEPVVTGICESTGKHAPLYAVRHHQPGNPHIWLYSAQAKAAHEREVAVVAKLKEVALTHPAQADTPQVAGLLHKGMSVEDVKAKLDRERTPELEAEVV